MFQASNWKILKGKQVADVFKKLKIQNLNLHTLW